MIPGHTERTILLARVRRLEAARELSALELLIYARAIARLSDIKEKG